MDGSSETLLIQGFLSRIRSGEESAKDELLSLSSERLRRLTRKMLRGFPGVRRWEETDDVFVNALVRLSRAMESVTPESPRHFFRLSAVQIRRELLDLSRHYFGPHGHGAHHHSAAPRGDAASGERTPNDISAPTFDPIQLGGWEEFHRQVGELPDEDREAFELLWYHELSQTDAAELLGISRRTVVRRWQSACLRLHDALRGEMP